MPGILDPGDTGSRRYWVRRYILDTGWLDTGIPGYPTYRALEQYRVLAIRVGVPVLVMPDARLSIE